MPGKPAQKPTEPFILGWPMMFVWWAILTVVIVVLPHTQVKEIPYSEFLTNVQSQQVEEVVIKGRDIDGVLRPPKESEQRPANPSPSGASSTGASEFIKGFGQNSPPKKIKFHTITVDPDLVKVLQEKGVKFTGQIETNFWTSVFSWLFPIILLIMVVNMVIGKNDDRTAGGGLLSIGRSRARVYMEEQIKVTFADVAGVDEAKEELKEIVTFLKEPERYLKLGGKLPKGVLLVGPPGTGKTLLARAVAGEAGVPFFSISGSEFVELFVGVGAARVRDLFERAKAKAPCIIFIDELDALGRARGAGPMIGGHDEKEQTLNQLLSELDGFDTTQGVILLAATNRPEILDPALLRAGRFDRQVLVDRPDKKGRIAILQIHLRDVVMAKDIDVEEIASMTPGFTGADLANLVNEATLLAARRNAETVEHNDFNAAIERIVAGLEKKNRLLNEHERRVVAFHEMGHALVSLSLQGSEPVQKISIIPRGISALGYTLQRPTEDRFLMTKEELLQKMTILMGGRAAENLIFGAMSTGAADDFVKATEIARNMVTRYGMAQEIGMVSFEDEPSPFLQNGKSVSYSAHFSEDTARTIDKAITGFVQSAYLKAESILSDKIEILKKAADLLLLKETLTGDELNELVDSLADSQEPGFLEIGTNGSGEASQEIVRTMNTKTIAKQRM